jgi:hypothetical protein
MDLAWARMHAWASNLYASSTSLSLVFLAGPSMAFVPDRHTRRRMQNSPVRPNASYDQQHYSSIDRDELKANETATCRTRLDQRYVMAPYVF